MAAVHGLVGTFDLDGYGGLAFLADGDLFVVALDGLAVVVISRVHYRKGLYEELTLFPC